MHAAEHKKHTYSDYSALPEGSPYQLIDGELILTPAPVPEHQRIGLNIKIALATFLTKKDLGQIFDAPIDVYFGENETYQPDIIYISKERRHIIGEKKIEGAPDVVVEILSPSTAYYDLKHKKRIYESSGVREYWIVDPDEKTFETFENIAGKFQLIREVSREGKIQSKILPGFEFDWTQVFS